VGRLLTGSDLKLGQAKVELDLLRLASVGVGLVVLLALLLQMLLISSLCLLRTH
jgi:hypothetical protein